MANRDLPRRGSRPANALSSLLTLGGIAEFSAWYRVASNGISRQEFRLLVIDRLTLNGLIEMKGDRAKLTDAARVYLGVAKPALPWEGRAPEPRTGNGFKPLRARSPMVFREGAFEYRDIPSMMGGVQVPYKSSVRPESE